MVEFQITTVQADDTIKVDFMSFDPYEWYGYFSEFLGLTPCYDRNAPAEYTRKKIAFCGERNGEKIFAQVI